MFSRYYYYLCNVRVNNFRVQNRVRVVLSLFFKAYKLHGKSMVITVKLHCFYIIKAMEFARNLYRLWSWWLYLPIYLWKSQTLKSAINKGFDKILIFYDIQR